MNIIIDTPIIFTTSVINLFNNLIDNKAINIKKLYKLNNYILENNLLNIKNIYCKHRTTKNYICLNKCIPNSKYCKVHDPIMKEQKRINRAIMNNRRKLLRQEIKRFMKIEYDIKQEYSYNTPATNLEYIQDKGIITKNIDSVINLSYYKKKSDEDDKKFVNNYNSISIDSVINETENILKYYYTFNIKTRKNIIYHIRSISKDIKNSCKSDNVLKNIIQNLLAIKYDDNNKEIIIPTIDIYKDKLNNTDYTIFNNYRGHKLHKLVYNIINTQIKAYYIKNQALFNDNSISTFISNILKNIQN